MYVESTVTDVVSTMRVVKKGTTEEKTIPVHTVVVDGKEIDLGFKKCIYTKGSLFKGDITDKPNRWGKYELSKGPITNGSSVAPSSPQPAYMPGGKMFPIPKSDHATSICRQSGLQRAVEILVAMGQYDNLTGVDEAVALTLDLAYQLTKFTTGQGEVEEAERIMNASTHVKTA